MSQALSLVVEEKRESHVRAPRTIFTYIVSIFATPEFLSLRHADGSKTHFQVEQRLTLMHRNGRHDFVNGKSQVQAVFLHPSENATFSVQIEENASQLIAAVNEHSR